MTADELRAWWKSATPAERDARVAEKVMELGKFRKDEHGRWWCYELADGSKQEPGFYVLEERYSTTWAGAGLVIEKMREASYRSRDAFGRALNDWFIAEAVPERPAIVRWPNAVLFLKPEGVCLAAVLAVEGNVSRETVTEVSG